jgi:hypothetical protein
MPAFRAHATRISLTYFALEHGPIKRFLVSMWLAALWRKRGFLKELACGQPVAKLHDMNAAGPISHREMVRCATSAGPSVEADDDDPPGGSVDHGDLLDAAWLQRADEDIGGDDDLVEVALTLDLDAADDVDELAQFVDLDVGALLTSLLPSAGPSETVDTSSEPTPREPNDASFGLGALREHLLPEATLDPARAGQVQREDEAERGDDERGDDEVGDDERFPVFEEVSMVPTPARSTDETDDE